MAGTRSAQPVLGDPANRNRAVPLTYEQFRFGFVNAVSEDESKDLYATFAVPASGVPLFQAATANLNPWTEAKVTLVVYFVGDLGSPGVAYLFWILCSA